MTFQLDMGEKGRQGLWWKIHATKEQSCKTAANPLTMLGLGVAGRTVIVQVCNELFFVFSLFLYPSLVASLGKYRKILMQSFATCSSLIMLVIETALERSNSPWRWEGKRLNLWRIVEADWLKLCPRGGINLAFTR